MEPGAFDPKIKRPEHEADNYPNLLLGLRMVELYLGYPVHLNSAVFN
jgi:hypothetical protein